MNLSIDDLSAFVRRERNAMAAEGRLDDLLSDEELVERGLAVEGLRVASQNGRSLILTCDRNDSRIRPGSRVRLECSSDRLEGVVLNVRSQGKVIELSTSASRRRLSLGPWLAREIDVDLSAVVLQCLNKLQPGAPGWGLAKVLSGLAPPTSTPGHDRTLRLQEAVFQRPPSAVLDSVIQDSGITLDASQISVARACLDLPPILGIQGPPGTGKTKTLAAVCESLIRMQKRVVVTAPTHQAVNNALSTIHNMFPSCNVVKIGDELHRDSLHENIECRLLKDVASELPRTISLGGVVGMTYFSALTNLALRSSGLSPHALIVEEAGQLPLAQGVVAGLLGAGSVLLFGDDAQMPPIFSGEAAGDPCAVSLLARLRTVAPDAIKMINISYRLNDELCTIIARNFYGGEKVVTSSPQAAEQRLSSNSDHPALACSSSLVWIRSPAIGRKQLNETDAKYVANLIECAMKGGLGAADIAVVTPFRRQASLIRNCLQEVMPAPMVPIVDTVERVQGLTVELVIISLCASDVEYANNIASFLFSPNRFNVALSRARRKAIIVASPTVFDGLPHELSGLRGQRLYRSILRTGDSIDL